jgi:hypothetical protein
LGIRTVFGVAVGACEKKKKKKRIGAEVATAAYTTALA